MAKTDPRHAKSRARADGLASNGKSASELHAKEQTYKRPFDLAILLLAHLIPLLWPVWVLLWTMIPLAIWLGDRGPVFYRQKRVGKGGRVFTLLKFRTMVPDAEYQGPGWTGTEDVRVTRIGRILRSAALDEIPQLISIWKGDISFVGPRPLPPAMHAAYCQEEPDFPKRLMVRPGLTGLASIKLPRHCSSSKRLLWDLAYIQQASLWLDIKLLVISVWLTLTCQWGKGSRSLGADTSSKTEA